MKSIARKITPERSDDMETIADELREKGKEEGKKEGRKEELVDVLKTFLEDRFGEIPDEISTKIENSSMEELEKLKDNFFKIENIEDVGEILE
ncbi:DUF4351 domain-containing protein [Halarsenatibacter silvermanii]|nr:DUF4351 domain-containing protein [Halarsenatibacter silvermanii]